VIPVVVQLAPADQHRADLGQLALLPTEAVGLGVDGEEFDARQRLLEQFHATGDTRSDGRRESRIART
jgi:hypothetical protein